MVGSFPYILSCGAVIVRWDGKEFQYLLLKAYDFWDFPKGQIEEGETPFEAALREVEEETTITPLNFKWGRNYYETPPYYHGKKVARYYLAETEESKILLPVNPDLGRPEHSDWCWVSRNEIFRYVTPRVRKVIYWSDKYLAYDKRIKRKIFKHSGDKTYDRTT